ncbi:putative DNA repair protein RAD5 [Blattamonas nauphoetae]|uniref:DNA repair protein RAD5 n=1 Tax=Blattamonas nauphoetae TaxID=2049346 RepID=A0ABQ9Y5Z1_9EUKA|nr:putative DNA repair protein RAD5 [Blattamonas nauphoetae]
MDLGPWAEDDLVYQSFPTTFIPVSDALSMKLHPHQVEGLNWLYMRETDPPGGFTTRGGILADDMGLGKTLTVLSLVVLDVLEKRINDRKQTYADIPKLSNTADDSVMSTLRATVIRKQTRCRTISNLLANKLPSIHATLIVVPKGVINHWAAEISRFGIGRQRLKLYVSHPSFDPRQKPPPDGADVTSWSVGLTPSEAMKRCDICIISYSVARIQYEKLKEWLLELTTKLFIERVDKKAEGGTSDDDSSGSPTKIPSTLTSDQLATMLKEGETEWPTLSFEWRRVVLDEAHNIKNKKTEQTKAMNSIQSQNRWGLTGTPIQNEIEDLASLIRFVGLGRTKAQEVGWRGLILRRKKNEVMSGEIAEKKIHEIRLKLSDDEKQFYQTLERDSIFEAGKFLHLTLPGGNRPGAHRLNLLDLILRLQQASIHPALVVLTMVRKGHKLYVFPEVLGTVLTEWRTDKTLMFEECKSPPPATWMYQYGITLNHPDAKRGDLCVPIKQTTKKASSAPKSKAKAQAKNKSMKEDPKSDSVYLDWDKVDGIDSPPSEIEQKAEPADFTQFEHDLMRNCGLTIPQNSTDSNEKSSQDLQTIQGTKEEESEMLKDEEENNSNRSAKPNLSLSKVTLLKDDDEDSSEQERLIQFLQEKEEKEKRERERKANPPPVVLSPASMSITASEMSFPSIGGPKATPMSFPIFPTKSNGLPNFPPPPQAQSGRGVTPVPSPLTSNTGSATPGSLVSPVTFPASPTPLAPLPPLPHLVKVPDRLPPLSPISSLPPLPSTTHTPSTLSTNMSQVPPPLKISPLNQPSPFSHGVPSFPHPRHLQPLPKPSNPRPSFSPSNPSTSNMNKATHLRNNDSDADPLDVAVVDSSPRPSTNQSPAVQTSVVPSSTFQSIPVTIQSQTDRPSEEPSPTHDQSESPIAVAAIPVAAQHVPAALPSSSPQPLSTPQSSASPQPSPPTSSAPQSEQTAQPKRPKLILKMKRPVPTKAESESELDPSSFLDTSSSESNSESIEEESQSDFLFEEEVKKPVKAKRASKKKNKEETDAVPTMRINTNFSKPAPSRNNLLILPPSLQKRKVYTRKKRTLEPNEELSSPTTLPPERQKTHAQYTFLASLPHKTPTFVATEERVNYKMVTLDSYQLPKTTMFLFYRHCALCRRMLVDPVMTPCGHSFCRRCMQIYTLMHEDSERRKMEDKRNAKDNQKMKFGAFRHPKRLFQQHPFSPFPHLGCPVCGEKLIKGSSLSQGLIQSVYTLISTRKGRDIIGMEKKGSVYTLSVDLENQNSEDRPPVGLSTKTRALVNYIKTIPPQDKIVVFSQWTTCLDLIQEILVQNGISFARFDGGQNIQIQNQNLTQFVDTKKDSAQVLIASLRAGGIGLNLMSANHVVLMDKWWNPFIEQQAMDRVHRIGQKKEVTVLRLTVEDGVEERIEALQNLKTKVSAEILREETKITGKSEGDQFERLAATLSLQDLYFLIGTHPAPVNMFPPVLPLVPLPSTSSSPNPFSPSPNVLPLIPSIPPKE